MNNLLEPSAAASPVTINVSAGGTASITINVAAPALLPVAAEREFHAAAPERVPTEERVIRFDEDYSNRSGYDPAYLGVSVALPTVVGARQGELYRKNGQVVVLKYNHFSLVMNRARRLLMWSASNVDYNEAMRPIRGRAAFGTDKWRPDPRVPAGLQVQDADFYAPATLVDRGHIVRRDDNAWGHSKRETEYANSDTFHWTNCTPQHESFNRGNEGGLWGEFEDHIVGQIAGFGKRVSLFAGPVLDDDDPGKDYGTGYVQYPLKFWKVIAGSENGQLIAYAFVLDQSEVIERYGLEKEVFRPGKFKRLQVPIAHLTELTGVQFDQALLDVDVMAGEQPMELENLESTRLRRATH